MVLELPTVTVDDYHRRIDAGAFVDRRVELLQGQIVDMPPERPIHASTYRKALRYLQQLLGERAEVLPATPIDLSETDSEPEPDLTIAQSPLERYDDRHPTPADIYWVVEISNTTLEYDLEQKARTYARAQLREYWVADVQAKVLWVHRQPSAGRYRSKTSLQAGIVVPLAFPDLEVSVKQLLS
ncbi:Uma2 family endonuclease [Synechococcus sp. PCC 7336]|uniref:Uma2 family endonuclease n=1 Tax=Synechococcus sp. PCC 7336 TaxID=195250 RepID=UPI00034C4DDC|nr:Uma2 family endonuclease [Synechococcus sp. PCC 7336]